MNVLVIGSGGREHALAWKLAQSSSSDRVFVAPGNAGTERDAENVDIAPSDIPKLIRFSSCMSNACYVLNRRMARLLLKESSKTNGIRHTSDVFTHTLIPNKFKRVQRLAILPLPSTQLSMQKKVATTIRTKNLNSSTNQCV